MSKVEKWLADYSVDVKFPEVSGFEILEMLDIRSKLATSENELSTAQKKQLEEADALFLRNASQFFASVSEICDLGEMRKRAAAPCSHWWWYLEKLAAREPVAVMRDEVITG